VAGFGDVTGMVIKYVMHIATQKENIEQIRPACNAMPGERDRVA
jgi:hypothetical protein